MNKVTYSAFFDKSKKGVDSWLEVFVFDVISPPFGYLLYRLFGKFKALPYLLTTSHFILKLIAAYLFLIGNWIIAPILFFIALIIDNIDGKVSRMIYGKDPDIRGTTDFVFDSLSLFLICAGISINLMTRGLILQGGLAVLLMVLLGFFFAMSAAKFRIYGIFSYNPNKSLKETNKKLANNPIMELLFSIQESAKKLRIPFYPTTVEAEALAILVFPFFVSEYWLLILASAIIAVDTIAAGLLPVYSLLRSK